jgi:tetratricopeptide (TPR) repeat protein/tRNA A-37 threonylcarbamoyl transferase component Bud32
MTTGWRDALQNGLGSAYRIRQELGGGGMSRTYIAEETALGRNVVLKALSPELSAGLNVDRFNREIHLAAVLQHAFIVPLLAAGIIDGQPWYTMPLIQGEPLRARLSREGMVPASATARILRDISEALAYAHAQGVVHRDIKPDNILLSGAHALVTDFGVAKALWASTAAGSEGTGVGMAIGTPAYMAPEQAVGDPATDHRADLYALGVMAYEMLAGRPMFSGRSPAQLLAAHATESPESLAKVAPGVPTDLLALVDQLLAKHPNDRPSRAQDVADALSAMITRWTSGELPPASHITLTRALALWAAAFAGVVGGAWLAVRWLPVPPWTLPAAVVVMVVGLPVLALTAWLQRPAQPVRPVASVASTTTVGRIEAVARPHLTWAQARRGGIAAVSLLAVLAIAWTGSRSLGIGPAATLRAQGKIAATDRVFVADFESPPSDTGLGTVVSDLLRTEVGRSPSILLVADNARSNVLMAMGRPTAERVGSSLAREFSTRANAKAYVIGTVTKLGESYLLRASLVETSTGTELAPFKKSARSADDILNAVDRMGRELRERLGASLREIRGAPDLILSVTPSLDAARLYSQGIRAANTGDQRAALRLLQKAVEVDTEFAMAYRNMASYAGNFGQDDLALWASERAFRYRNKLPGVLRAMVEGTYYYSYASFDLDKSIAAYESGREQYGETQLNNLAQMYRDKRDFERSLAVYREAVATDTLTVFATTNLPTMLWATGRKDETRQYIETKLARWFPNSRQLVTAQAGLAAAELHPDSAERVLESNPRMAQASSVQRAILGQFLAAVQRTRGKLSSSQRSLLQAGSLDPIADTARRIPRSLLDAATIVAWDRAESKEARRILDSAVAAHPSTGATALGYPWTRLATLYAMAGDGAAARRFLESYDQRATPSMKLKDKQTFELARGWIAVAEKRYAEAITSFRAADVYVCTICALAPLANAYDLAGQPDSAIAVFERYVSTNYLPRMFVDGEYLAGTYKRLGELYEAKGDLEKTRTYYTRFIELWRDADPELQPKVSEVKRRLAALKGPDQRR